MRFARLTTMLGYFALLTLLTAKFTLLGDSTGFPVALTLLIFVGPLLLPLRGLLHGRPESHLWISFLSLFYFTAGVFNAAGGPSQPWIATLEISLSVLLFLGTTLYLRTSKHRQSVADPIASAPSRHSG